MQTYLIHFVNKEGTKTRMGGVRQKLKHYPGPHEDIEHTHIAPQVEMFQ